MLFACNEVQPDGFFAEDEIAERHCAAVVKEIVKRPDKMQVSASRTRVH